MSSTGATIGVRYTGMLGRFKLDVAFDVPMRGITALFGPSGCGKTTVLRCMAGLNRVPGRLAIGGKVWQDDAAGKFLAPHERPIGYVFQEASLFAHLSVRGNLLYGYRRALKKGARATINFDEVVELLGIGPLIDRATGELSGGERQRIALGRALLAQPQLFLMDEPLSALDRMTKEEILPYLEKLRTSSSIPVFYVSHDMAEVERLADQMVLLNSGRVTAVGPLNELMTDPRLPIARSPRASTILEARVGAYDAEDGLTVLDIGGEKLLVPRRIAKEAGTDRVRIAATDISLAVDRPSLTTILNVMAVRVKDIHPVDDAQVNVLCGIGHRDGGPLLLVRITRRALRVLGFAKGQDIYAQVKAVSLIASSDPPLRGELAEMI
jgi:molybdate transport system ATP-binding protein